MLRIIMQIRTFQQEIATSGLKPLLAMTCGWDSRAQPSCTSNYNLTSHHYLPYRILYHRILHCTRCFANINSLSPTVCFAISWQ